MSPFCSAPGSRSWNKVRVSSLSDCVPSYRNSDMGVLSENRHMSHIRRDKIDFYHGWLQEKVMRIIKRYMLDLYARAALTQNFSKCWRERGYIENGRNFMGHFCCIARTTSNNMLPTCLIVGFVHKLLNRLAGSCSRVCKRQPTRTLPHLFNTHFINGLE